MRRPTDATVEQFRAWMDETSRVMDALRAEVEELRRERVELHAHLRFATAQCNLETLASAELRAELDELRAAPARIIEMPSLAIADEEDTGVMRDNWFRDKKKPRRTDDDTMKVRHH